MKMRLIVLLTIILFSASWAHGQTPEDRTLQNDRPDSKTVQIWPNPADDFIHVKLANVPAERVKVSVHNIIGNEIAVESEVLYEDEISIIRIRVKDLTGGYYLLALKDQDNTFRGTYKFLKR